MCSITEMGSNAPDNKYRGSRIPVVICDDMDDDKMFSEAVIQKYHSGIIDAFKKEGKTFDFMKDYFSLPVYHDEDACNAFKAYHEYQDKRDAMMFEQIPFKKGFINGRRLNTPHVPYKEMDFFASRHNTTVERMKEHWRCVPDY